MKMIEITNSNMFTYINNETDLTMIISSVPVKPKRKSFDLFFVRPKHFLIIEQEIDLKKYSFRFE